MPQSLIVKTRKRIIFLLCITIFLFILLLLRLAEIQLIETEKFNALASQQYTEKIYLNALRGSIYDCSGEILALSFTSTSIAANPYNIKDPSKTAYILSELLHIDQKKLEKDLSQKSHFVWLARKVDTSICEKVKALNLPGIEIIKEPTGKRSYLKGALACHILGYTGIDDQGLAGIEYYYREFLEGTPGYVITEVDGKGKIIPEGKWEAIPAIPGYDLYLTIDETIQYIAERELFKAIQAHQAKDGTIIVIKPKTGEILAIANYPSYEGENFYQYPETYRINQAITNCYEPGSTFKVFLAAAALDSKSITMEEEFFCGRYISIGGWRIHNADDGLESAKGRENIENIVKYSFNVGASSIALKLGKENFYRYLKAFGFGSTTEIDLPGESMGILPPLEEWNEARLATISFGQGISVTPIQLISAFSAIANNGILMKPFVVKAIKNKAGETIKEFSPVTRRVVINPQTARLLTSILKTVVEEGTGRLAQIKGYTVAGKTGTAQISENGHYVTGKYIASFIGFVPAEDPEIAILVKIGEPKKVYWGGVVAAPVFREVAKEVLWKLKVSPSQ